MDEPPVRMLSHYRLVEKIGEGGMGVVWMAEDTILGRSVAIKILPADVSRDENRRAMFLEEARAASAASHAHVVQVHEFGHERGLDFIVMEYVEGRPLGRILVGRPLPSDKVAQLGVQIARALQAAHRKGLLHRDLKPSNVLVTGDGEVKVVDFGLAALLARRPATDDEPTQTNMDPDATGPGGSTAGTLPYMSPEQVRGESLDARSDVFALGVVLYEMATGQRPFEGATSEELARAILAAAPKPVHELVPSVPLELERIVQKALARKPGERYQTMDDFAVDLKRLDHDLESGSAPSYEALRGAVSAAPPPVATSAPAPRRRRVGLVAAFSAAATVALAASAWWLARGRGPQLDAKTVLVLPFEIHGGSGDAYLGQALAEAVAVNLSEVQALRLLPVPAAGDRSGDALAAARAAGAARVLAGSLTRESGVLHVSLTLLDARDGRLVGGVLRDETRPDLTVLAAGIATELAGKMQVAARRAYEYALYLNGDPKMVGSPDASAALEGWKSGRTRNGLEPAARLAQAFPGEIGALALYAYLLEQLQSGAGAADRDRFEQVLGAIDRLDPRNPYTAYFRSSEAKTGGRYDEARAGYAKLLARDDLTPACRAWFLRNASTLGIKQLRYDVWLDAPAGPREALGEALATDVENLRKSVALDPANPWSHLYLSWVLHMSGRNSEAIPEAQRAVALEPLFTLPRVTLGSFLGAAGRWQEAADGLSPACDEVDGPACALLGVALGHLHRSGEARAAIAKIPSDANTAPALLLQLAQFWMGEGDRSKAKAFADRAMAAGLPSDRLAVEPDLAALASKR